MSDQYKTINITRYSDEPLKSLPKSIVELPAGLYSFDGAVPIEVYERQRKDLKIAIEALQFANRPIASRFLIVTKCNEALKQIRCGRSEDIIESDMEI